MLKHRLNVIAVIEALATAFAKTAIEIVHSIFELVKVVKKRRGVLIVVVKMVIRV